MEPETPGVVGGGFDDLIRRNRNLVRTTHSLRRQLNSFCHVVGNALDLAEPANRDDGEDPQEYVLPAEEIDAMRMAILMVRIWGVADEC